MVTPDNKIEESEQIDVYNLPNEDKPNHDLNGETHQDNQINYNYD